MTVSTRQSDTEIRYRGGYKYQLHRPYSFQSDIITETRIKAELIHLYEDGWMVILPWYAWDGPSGPAMDTLSAMRGSLEHDATYQLLRMKLLPPKWRAVADRRYKKVCLEDGMWPLRAWYHFVAIKSLAGNAADPSSRKKIITAP